MLGFININKPSGISSNAVVSKIRKKLNIKKIGHMGTLDPLACGVLPIAVGKATRTFNYFLNKEKSYIAEFEFGYETTTLDSEGDVVNSSNLIPTKQQIESVLCEFIGKVAQIPPNFSAKKINGVNAYNLARKNVEIDLKPCLIEIFNIRLIDQISQSKYSFEITCGSGTYIRAIARDIAYKLGTFATMTNLVRIKSGSKFDIENSIKLDDFLLLDNPEKTLLPCDYVFDFNKFNLTDEQFKNTINGLNNSFIEPFKENTFLYYNNQLVGIAENNINYIKIKTNLFER